MRTRLARNLGRGVWDKWYGMGRIGLNAVLRMAFGVGIARLAGRESFAVFVGLVAIEIVALTLLTAGWVTPLGSIAPRVPGGERDAFVSAALRRTLRACAITSALLAMGAPLALLLAGVPVAVHVAFALSTGAWLASSAVAGALAARFRSGGALLAQAGAQLLPVAAIVGAWLGGFDPLFGFFAANALGHAAATALMLRLLPAGGGAVAAPLLAEFSRYGRVVLTGSVANSLCTRVQPFVLASVGGALAISVFGAANTLVGPARVFSGALGEVLRPRLAVHQGAGGDARRGRRALGLACGALGGIGVAMLALFLAAGERIAVLVFGPGFEDLGAVLPWAAGFVLVSALVNLLVVAMQTLSLEGTAVATRARIGAAVLSLVAVWPACAWDGARGAFAAMTAAELVFLWAALRFLGAARRSAGPEPALARAT